MGRGGGGGGREREAATERDRDTPRDPEVRLWGCGRRGSGLGGGKGCGV